MTQPSATISALIVRYVNGDATPEEKQQLEEWASLSAENRIWLEQFSDSEWLQEQSIIHNNIDLDERCETFWAMVAAQQAVQTEQTLQTQQSDKPGKGKVLIVSFYIRAAIFIAALAGAFFLAAPETKVNETASLFNNNPEKPAAIDNTSRQQVHKTASIDSFSNAGRYTQVSIGGTGNQPLFYKYLIPAGGYYKFQLPDGSRVWLNSMTTCTYPSAFKGDLRRVDITGEAYFEVKSDSAMPFLAVVNGVYIKTTGGCFNINAHKEEAGKKVTVLQGDVSVAAGPNEAFIKENQSALIEPKKCIDVEPNEDITKVLAWKDKQFLFRNDKLSMVLKELARRYDLTLLGNINSDATISYEGTKTDEPDVVLKQIQQLNRNFLYKLEGRLLTIE